jgi:hypothetical protein
MSLSRTRTFADFDVHRFQVALESSETLASDSGAYAFNTGTMVLWLMTCN